MASNPTTPLVSRKLFLNNNNLDSVTNVNSKGRPRIALDITAATTTAGTDGGDGNDGATSLSTASPTATTRIPIARSGSIRRMRNSKSFSNDHQLSRSLTRADDHYYVSTFRNSKNDFLTLNKFGSAGSMHKACSSSGSGGDNNGGGAIKSHFANGDCTDATVTANIRQNHKLAPTTTTTTNGKYFAAERSMALNLNGGDQFHHPQRPTSFRSPRTPQTPGSNKSPLVSNRSFSTPHTPPVSPDYPNGYIEDDDLDSLRSYSSSVSNMSCDYHSPVPRNGTTFSGRRLKYVVHCSQYAGQTGSDYLTPTQRAQKHIRRLRELLAQARADLELKDSEILKLTKEVVELRLFKASLSSPEERSNSSDAVTVKENTINDACNSSNDVSPIVDMIDESKPSPRHQLHNPTIIGIQMIEKMTNSEMHSSFADSGHFEDMTTSSVHSKDSYNIITKDQATHADGEIDEDRQALIEMYERKIEELIRQHDCDKQELQTVHNDKVEALLQKLADANARFVDLMPDYEQAKERIRELERQLDELQTQLQEQEDKANKLYLHMYTKGQEAERISHSSKVLEVARAAPSRVTVPELMQQLQVTQDELDNLRDDNFEPEVEGASSLLSAKEAISLWLLGARKQMYSRLIEAQQTKNRIDPEVKLQFLKSAVYYFLTDKENSQGHLNAIESILGFSEQEKATIAKLRLNK